MVLTFVQVPVPRSMIGIIIGKGGEMIKKIQQESGARIQFRPDDEQGGPNRMCNITGNQEQMAAAGNMIQEILVSWCCECCVRCISLRPIWLKFWALWMWFLVSPLPGWSGNYWASGERKLWMKELYLEYW